MPCSRAGEQMAAAVRAPVKVDHDVKGEWFRAERGQADDARDVMQGGTGAGDVGFSQVGE